MRTSVPFFVIAFFLGSFNQASAQNFSGEATSGLAQELPGVEQVEVLPVAETAPANSARAIPALSCRQRTLRASDQFATIKVNRGGQLSRVQTRYSLSPVLANIVFNRSTGPGARGHVFESVQVATLADLAGELSSLKARNDQFLPTTVSTETKQLKQDNFFVLNNLMSGQPRTDWFNTNLPLESQSTLVIRASAQIVDEASGRFVDSTQTLYVQACPKMSTEGCRAFNVLDERINEGNGVENKRFEVGHFVCQAL